MKSEDLTRYDMENLRHIVDGYYNRRPGNDTAEEAFNRAKEEALRHHRVRIAQLEAFTLQQFFPKMGDTG